MAQLANMETITANHEKIDQVEKIGFKFGIKSELKCKYLHFSRFQKFSQSKL